VKTADQVAAPSGRGGDPSAASAGFAIARAMLEEFEAELDITRRFIERVPADRLNWRPHEKSMTAGQLALHLAGIPATVLKFSMADEGNAPDFNAPRPQGATPAEVLGVFNASVEHVRQTLPTIDDERMQKTIRVVAGGRTVMSVPRASFLRSLMLNHWYQHRGQLGVYLRLLGAAVPSSYGPSADEPPRFANG
jgi:uncharacterized damage-inducible protein DinB